MAYPKYYGYQYETSPRKIEPEYEHKKNPYKNKKSTAKTKKNKKEVKVNNNMQKLKVTLYVAIGFTALFTISYRNSLITESFNEKEKLKEELAVIQKENEQLKVNIESSLNLSNVEQQAKELLGMQKLDNTQKVYISLSKKDYIETATETVDIEENLTIWQKIVKGLTQSIK
jgi:cell division protein FtsL